jgi:hypothetical protein
MGLGGKDRYVNLLVGVERGEVRVREMLSVFEIYWFPI